MSPSADAGYKLFLGPDHALLRQMLYPRLLPSYVRPHDPCSYADLRHAATRVPPSRRQCPDAYLGGSTSVQCWNSSINTCNRHHQAGRGPCHSVYTYTDCVGHEHVEEKEDGRTGYILDWFDVRNYAIEICL